jgi:aspartate/methionine/tyrosine aminotransferase
MKPTNATLSGLGTTIFEVMSRLAEQHQAINLGQGFPDEGFPLDVVAEAARQTTEGWNQYPSTMGVPELRQAVAEHGARFYGLDVDWRSEVIVTSGATEALASALLALIEPGDEVVVFQPLYDSYLPIIRRGGGVPRFVNLRVDGGAWALDLDELAKAFSPRTKAVLLNDPLNPAARVLTDAELDHIADLVLRHDAYAICDEVYEHLTFDGRPHRTLLAHPGLRDRVVKIGSAGKTFSLTGWKVGYVTAAPNLLQPIAKAHQFVTYTTPPNLQQAVAYGLRKDDAYYRGLTEFMTGRRDRLVDGLTGMGWVVLPVEGTYFCCVDIAGLGWTPPTGSEPGPLDAAFSQWLVREVGVATIPVSAFYDQDPVTSVIRFCFCKKASTIDAALDRLRRAFA